MLSIFVMKGLMVAVVVAVVVVVVVVAMVVVVVAVVIVEMVVEAVLVSRARATASPFSSWANLESFPGFGYLNRV